MVYVRSNKTTVPQRVVYSDLFLFIQNRKKLMALFVNIEFRSWPVSEIGDQTNLISVKCQQAEAG